MNCQYLHICTLLKDVSKRIESLEEKIDSIQKQMLNNSVMFQLQEADSDDEEDDDESSSSGANSAPF